MRRTTAFLRTPLPVPLRCTAARCARVVLDESLGTTAPALRKAAALAPTGGASVVVVHDAAPNALAAAVIAGYAQLGEEGRPFAFLPFDAATAKADVARVAAPGASVVLVQNSAFQNETKEYRLRLALFDMGLRVAEHCHLDTALFAGDARCAPNDRWAVSPWVDPALAARFGTLSPFKVPAVDAALGTEVAAAFTGPTSDATLLAQAAAATEGHLTPLQRLSAEAYLAACAESPGAMEEEGRRMAAAIDGGKGLTVTTAAGELTYGGAMERCLFNTGLYTTGRGIGGAYPVGEVITESRRLSAVSGVASVFAFPSLQKRVEVLADPFTLHIDQGVITDVSGPVPEEFSHVLGLVREAEGEAVVRELGLGLNRALGRHRVVHDVTAFERQWGVHVSMGKRHPLFPKDGPAAAAADGVAPDALRPYDGLRRKDGKYHLDLFLAATRLRTHDGALDVTY